MSPSFSTEEKEKLTSALDDVQKNMNYAIEQLKSAILHDLAPEDPQAMTRVIAMLQHFTAMLTKPADTLNVMRMEQEF